MSCSVSSSLLELHRNQIARFNLVIDCKLYKYVLALCNVSTKKYDLLLFARVRR